MNTSGRDAVRKSLSGKEHIGSVVHELIQPLTAILANVYSLKLILNEPTPSIKMISALIDDLAEDSKRAGTILGHLQKLIQEDHGQ